MPGIAQIPLRRLSPKLPAEKVMDTNHESRRHDLCRWQSRRLCRKISV